MVSEIPESAGATYVSCPSPPLPRPCPRRRRGSNNLQAQGFLSPLMAPRQHTLAKRHDFGVPRGRQGNRHPRKNTWSLSPPRSRRQQQPVTHIVFKPPSGDEAETTCESIWFLSSPRAPRQQQFVTTQGFRPSPPPPHPGPRGRSNLRKAVSGNCPGTSGKFPGNSRENPGIPPETFRKIQGAPEEFPGEFPGEFVGSSLEITRGFSQTVVILHDV